MAVHVEVEEAPVLDVKEVVEVEVAGIADETLAGPVSEGDSPFAGCEGDLAVLHAVLLLFILWPPIASLLLAVVQ